MAVVGKETEAWLAELEGKIELAFDLTVQKYGDEAVAARDAAAASAAAAEKAADAAAASAAAAAAAAAAALPPRETVLETVPAGPLFGDLIPSGDPQWYQGFRSPHYKQSHYDFRAKVRAFVEKEIDPYYEQWEANAYWEPGAAPDPSKQVNAAALVKAAADWGLLPATMGGDWPASFTDEVAPVDYDLFHSQVSHGLQLPSLWKIPTVAVSQHVFHLLVARS